MVVLFANCLFAREVILSDFNESTDKAMSVFATPCSCFSAVQRRSSEQKRNDITPITIIAVILLVMNYSHAIVVFISSTLFVA